MGVPQAEVQAEWPVEAWLQASQPAMNDPLMGVLRGSTDLNQGSTTLLQLGSQLYDTLFEAAPLRESWLRAQGIAQNRNEILRLRLGLKESRLQRLPWEVMQYDGRPLTTRSDLTFTRYAANFLVSQSLVPDSLMGNEATLSVLMAIASPHDQEHLQILQEAKRLKELLAVAHSDHHPIAITVLEQPDRSELAQALEQGNYQIFHYSGHSDLGDQGGDLSLVNRQTGLTERLSGDDLAGLLVNNHVALTVFNSCRSGHTAGDDAAMDWRQQNLVQALVNRGVPGVIAMAERIPDNVAIAFTQLLYKNLRRGYPIDLSLSRTRQGLIAAFGSDQHYWALPILYLHPEFDGYLSKRDRESDASLDPAELDRVETATPLPAITESALPETATTTPEALLTQLTEDSFSTGTDDSEDVAVADFVKQLSGPATVTEEPMPADQEEVLVIDNAEQKGLRIYDVLPDLPIAEEPIPPHTPPPSAVTTGGRSHPLKQPALFPKSPTHQKPESSALVWFALGLVGIIGVTGLGALTLGRTGLLGNSNNSVSTGTSTLPAPVEGSLDPATLVGRGEQALNEERYADARDFFDLALTQSLIGNTTADQVSNTIRALVFDHQNPSMAYIQGRILWQQMVQLTGDAGTTYATEQEQRTLASQAQIFWEQTDSQFIDARVARGFANYVIGDSGGAIENWEAALKLYEKQRENLPNPATSTVTEPIVLHAYAGLIMAYTQTAEEQITTLNSDLSSASSEEQVRLRADADNQLAQARELFLTLQDFDEADQVTPNKLLLINKAPSTWHNWLWPSDLINQWRGVYDGWVEQTQGPGS